MARLADAGAAPCREHGVRSAQSIRGGQSSDANRTRASTEPATTATLPRARLAFVLIGFAALLACLAVFGAIAEDVANEEAIALDAIMTPLLHS